MGRAGQWAAVWAVVALVSGNSGLAQTAKPGLKTLANELHLDGPGARAWLTRLGVEVNREPAERLLAVARSGDVIARLDGGAHHVLLGVEIDTHLRSAGSDLTLIHNHPASVGLSADDLSQLAKPGVFAVVAIGHDGSIYIAAAGRRFDRLLFEPTQYEIVRREVDRRLLEACAAGAISTTLADTQRAHLVALALAKAQVIEYQAVLAADRRASYDAARDVLGKVTVAAAGRVRR